MGRMQCVLHTCSIPPLLTFWSAEGCFSLAPVRTSSLKKLKAVRGFLRRAPAARGGGGGASEPSMKPAGGQNRAPASARVRTTR